MTITIIGLGLIGGSLALSLRQHGLADHLLGVEANPAYARRALELGLVDEIAADLAAAVAPAGLVVVAVPVDAMLSVLPQVLDLLTDQQVVIDVGSTKGSLLAAVAGHPRRGRFVAAHPMAGTEYSGPDAAVRGLFEGKTLVVCDAAASDADAVAAVEVAVSSAAHAGAAPGRGRARFAHGLRVAHLAPHLVCAGAHGVGEGGGGASSVFSTWRAAALPPPCGWPRARPPPGCPSSAKTGKTCSMCSMSTFRNCTSCANCWWVATTPASRRNWSRPMQYEKLFLRSHANPSVIASAAKQSHPNDKRTSGVGVVRVRLLHFARNDKRIRLTINT